MRHEATDGGFRLPQKVLFADFQTVVREKVRRLKRGTGPNLLAKWTSSKWSEVRLSVGVIAAR